MNEEYEYELNTQTMPSEIATAIAAVMAEVPKLQKGEKNSHGNYNFASIDDFLEAVRPLCAKSGLVIVQDEESFDMREGQDKFGKAVNWLVIRYQFTLAHISGSTWAHRPTRTIMVNAAMGSQAFGAAQSYALKQFERSLFQIGTGEKDADADAHPPADLPKHKATAKRTTNENGAESKPAEALAGEPRAVMVGLSENDEPDWRGWGAAMKATLQQAEFAPVIHAWWDANEAQLKNLKIAHPKWHEALEQVKRDRLATLKEETLTA